MEGVADALFVVLVGFQSANLEYELSIPVVEDRNLRIRRPGLVYVAEPSADACNSARQSGTGDGMERSVHLMRALVADIAVSVFPEPMPVVVDQILVIVPLCRRTAPEIEIQLVRRSSGLSEADASTALVAEPAGYQQLSVSALSRKCGDHVASGSPARAVLDDPVVLAGNLDGDAPLVNVLA